MTSQMAFRLAGGQAPETAHERPNIAAPTTFNTWKVVESGATRRSDTMAYPPATSNPPSHPRTANTNTAHHLSVHPAHANGGLSLGARTVHVQ